MKCILTFIVVTGLFLTAPALSSAAPILVTLDTSPLTGTQALGFVLVDSNAGSNTVTLSDFDFGGGAAVAGTDACLPGSPACTGDLTGVVTLSDFDFLVMFSQQFEPGSALSFVLNATDEYLGGIPDNVGMFVCDGGFTTCSEAMLSLDLGGSFVLTGAPDLGLDAPVGTTVPVPEPATMLLLGTGLAAAAAKRHRAQRHSPCSTKADQ